MIVNYFDKGVKKLPIETPQMYVGPDYFELLPDELIVKIFQEMNGWKDFFALAGTNQRLYAISMDPYACMCFIPRYLTTETTNPSIHKLSNGQKMRLNLQIQGKFLSRDALQIILQRKDLVGTTQREDKLFKKIIGNYLVIAPSGYDYIGVVEVHDLTTLEALSFRAHVSAVESCAVIQTPDPLLVTVNRYEGFKVWDLTCVIKALKREKLLKQDNTEGKDPFQAESLLKHDDTQYVARSDVDDFGCWSCTPVIATHKNVLGIGYQHHVLVEDCASFSPERSFTIKFSGVRQIQFTDTHMMLVSATELRIWKMSVIVEALKTGQTLKPASAFYTYRLETVDSWMSTPVNVKFAKIHNETVLIAYAKGYEEGGRFILGEVRNWETGEQLRLLSSRCGLRTRTFNAVDFQEHLMFTGSSMICEWNLKAIDGLKEAWDNKSYGNEVYYDSYKVYAMGQHILFANIKGVVVKKMGKKLCWVRDQAMHPWILTSREITDGPVSFDLDWLVSFDLDGTRLVTETQNGDSETRTITVYDLVGKKG